MDRRLGDDRRQRDRRAGGKGAVPDRRSGEERRRGERRQGPRSLRPSEQGPDELEFANAVFAFRERTGNRFPTAAQILAILRDLGYEKRSP